MIKAFSMDKKNKHRRRELNEVNYKIRGHMIVIHETLRDSIKIIKKHDFKFTQEATKKLKDSKSDIKNEREELNDYMKTKYGMSRIIEERNEAAHDLYYAGLRYLTISKQVLLILEKVRNDMTILLNKKLDLVPESQNVVSLKSFNEMKSATQSQFDKLENAYNKFLKELKVIDDNAVNE